MAKSEPGAVLDLSRASLGYAVRMARRFGVDVRFAPADILELGERSERFDVIVSVGVLPHLARPEAGLRMLLIASGRADS